MSAKVINIRQARMNAAQARMRAALRTISEQEKQGKSIRQLLRKMTGGAAND